MRLNELREVFRKELTPKYPESETEAVFALVSAKWLTIKPSEVPLKLQTEVSADGITFFNDALKQLKSGKPVQYILHEAAFLDMILEVNEEVLIPRPETEELVHLIINDERTKRVSTESLGILDIGTGSGCIALALKRRLPNSKVTAMDISAGAIEIGKKNARKYKLDIDFIQADILSALPRLDQPVDIIVSNPPYIMESEKKEMEPTVKDFEPHLALFVEDNNPLVFFSHILDFAIQNLSHPGKVFFEINPANTTKLTELCLHKGFQNTFVVKDMQQKERMLVTWR